MAKSNFEIIVEIVFWVMLVILVYQLLLKITGHSPADIAVLYTGFIAMTTYIVSLTYKFAKFSGKVEEFMKNTRQSFSGIKVDMHRSFDEIRGEMHRSFDEIRGEMHMSFNDIRGDIKSIKEEISQKR